jgi:putative flippase GtrA
MIAVVSAFLVHRTLVFGSTERWQASFVRFCLSQLVALGAGIVGLYVLVAFLHLNPLAAQAWIVAASVALTYVLHRFFSFRTR